MVASLCFLTENPAHLTPPRPPRQDGHQNCGQSKAPPSLKLLVSQRQQEPKLGLSASQMISPGALRTRSWVIFQWVLWTLKMLNRSPHPATSQALPELGQPRVPRHGPVSPGRHSHPQVRPFFPAHLSR